MPCWVHMINHWSTVKYPLPSDPGIKDIVFCRVWPGKKVFIVRQELLSKGKDNCPLLIYIVSPGIKRPCYWTWVINTMGTLPADIAIVGLWHLRHRAHFINTFIDVNLHPFVHTDHYHWSTWRSTRAGVVWLLADSMCTHVYINQILSL